LQAFLNLGYLEKKYIREHTNLYPRKSHFAFPKILFRTPEVREPPVRNSWSRRTWQNRL